MTESVEAVRIGVLADTHIPHRLTRLPSGVIEIFKTSAVDLILHAGDVDVSNCLEPLSQIAPVIAVRGNIHPQDFSRGGAELPYHVELILRDRRLILTHGHRRGTLKFWVKFVIYGAYRLGLISREEINRRIVQDLHHRFPQADIIIFGHTHKPYQKWIDGTFFFNPGSVLKDGPQEPSVGILTIEGDSITTEFIPLFLDRGI